MHAEKATDYRLALARGFLEEAEQDRELGRWRSCVDNSQLAVEDSGKAVISLFGVSPKTQARRARWQLFFGSGRSRRSWPPTCRPCSRTFWPWDMRST